MQGAFDFGRIDIFCSRHDHVLHPIEEIKITIGVEKTGIAGAVPFSVESSLSCLRQIVITAHN